MTGTVLVHANGGDSQTPADNVHVWVSVTAGTVITACAKSTAGCPLGDVSSADEAREVSVKIPTSMTKAGTIKVTATASAANIENGKKIFTYPGTISVAKKPAAKSNSSSSSHSSSSSSSNGGAGSSGGSSGSGSSGTTTTGLDSSVPFAAANSGGGLQVTQQQTAQFPQVPQVAPPTANGTAPPGSQATQTMGSLRAAPAGPTELTFQRLASTQAAWLAALLVAFSLLLTQVRLGRPLDARGRKGTHRRGRKGAFQS